jgi:hypothetical protein
MSLAILSLCMLGWAAPSAGSDSVRLAGLKGQLPPEVQVRLQTLKGQLRDSTQSQEWKEQQANRVRRAREQRELLLKSLSPEERAKLELDLEQIKKRQSEHAQMVRQRTQDVKFRQ